MEKQEEEKVPEKVPEKRIGFYANYTNFGGKFYFGIPKPDIPPGNKTKAAR